MSYYTWCLSNRCLKHTKSTQQRWATVLVIHCWINKPLNLHDIKQQPFYYAPGFCGSGTWKMESGDSLSLLCNVWSLNWAGSEPGGDSTAGGWDHPMASSLHHSGAWCWLLAGNSTQSIGSNTYMEPLHVAMWFLSAWWLAFMSQHPKRQGLKVASFLRPWTGNWPSFTSFVLLWSKQSQGPPRFKGRGHRPHHLMGGMSVPYCGKRTWGRVYRAGHLWKLPQLLLLLILCSNSY